MATITIPEAVEKFITFIATKILSDNTLTTKQLHDWRHNHQKARHNQTTTKIETALAREINLPNLPQLLKVSYEKYPGTRLQILDIIKKIPDTKFPDSGQQSQITLRKKIQEIAYPNPKNPNPTLSKTPLPPTPPQKSTPQKRNLSISPNSISPPPTSNTRTTSRSQPVLNTLISLGLEDDSPPQPQPKITASNPNKKLKQTSPTQENILIPKPNIPNPTTSITTLKEPVKSSITIIPLKKPTKPTTETPNELQDPETHPPLNPNPTTPTHNIPPQLTTPEITILEIPTLTTETSTATETPPTLNPNQTQLLNKIQREYNRNQRYSNHIAILETYLTNNKTPSCLNQNRWKIPQNILNDPDLQTTLTQAIQKTYLEVTLTHLKKTQIITNQTLNTLETESQDLNITPLTLSNLKETTIKKLESQKQKSWAKTERILLQPHENIPHPQPTKHQEPTKPQTTKKPSNAIPSLMSLKLTYTHKNSTNPTTTPTTTPSTNTTSIPSLMSLILNRTPSKETLPKTTDFPQPPTANHPQPSTYQNNPQTTINNQPPTTTNTTKTLQQQPLPQRPPRTSNPKQQ
jgi:hypothetical protein